MRVRDTGGMHIVWLVVFVGALLPFAVLTTLGAHQRGYSLPLALLAGLLFPVTWPLWYVRDERPYRRMHRHVV